MGKLYIAYGSNLNIQQMASRCPSATIYATGVLSNWELIYRGKMTNSHATIRKKNGASVPVLVWSIQPSDEYRLDRYEGYPFYYYKKSIMVDIAGNRKKGMVYIMNDHERPGKPSQQYIATIQQGYIDNSFDLAFLQKSLELNTIECT